MSHGYQAVLWTDFVKRFDLWMLCGIVLYLAAFIAGSAAFVPVGESFTAPQTLIRATGTLSFLMLSFVLCIGPLARLTPRFKPFLYNRRHVGVTLFLIATIHFALSLIWYHGFGPVNPFVSIFISNPRYDSLSGFPFESLGFTAFLILFVMAATSHDFWNTNLGPGIWKALHMGVYGAYGLLVAHVALGALQYEKHPVYAAGLATSVLIVSALHIVSAFKSGPAHAVQHEDWLDAGHVNDIPEDRARVLTPTGAERIAVFKSAGKIAAVSNVCRHQAGPLGEGKVVDGCITCPWHGFQYRMEDGCSPPPFTEKIATYAVKVDATGQILVNAKPNSPGTHQTLAVIEQG